MDKFVASRQIWSNKTKNSNVVHICFLDIIDEHQIARLFFVRLEAAQPLLPKKLRVFSAPSRNTFFPTGKDV
jgi:hypothetical protein